MSTSEIPISKYATLSPDREFGTSQYSFINHSMTLNDNGIKLLNECQEKYDKGEIKATICDWFTLAEHSGWCNGTKIENYTICNDVIKTSIIILMDPDKKWAYTTSGSLYALKKII